MIRRRKNSKGSLSDSQFRASVRNYHQEQVRQKRLSNSGNELSRSIINEQDKNISKSRLELQEIEHETVNDLLSRVSVYQSPKNNKLSKSTINVLSPPKTSLNSKFTVSSATLPGLCNSSLISTLHTNPSLTSSSVANRLQTTTPQSLTETNPVIPGESIALQQKKTFANDSINKSLQLDNTEAVALVPGRIAANQSFFNQLAQQKAKISVQSSFSTPMTSSISQTNVLNQSLPTASPKPTVFQSHLDDALQSTSTGSKQLATTSQQPRPSSDNLTTPFHSSDSGSLSSSSSAFNASATKQESQPPRQRRPSKSETPESLKFSHWIKSTLKTYDELFCRLVDFKKNSMLLPLCNKIRMAIQETIDVYTTDNPKDIKNISAALIFFQDLYKTGATKSDDSPLPLMQGGKLFITMCICDRYLKRVVNQDACISFVATLFIVLSKNESEVFNVLLPMVFSKCVLPRLNAYQCLEHVLKLSQGSAEECAQWISEEGARFRLLVNIIALTTTKNEHLLRGQNLLQFLLKEALRAPAIPISTPFVLNTIFSVDVASSQVRKMSEFADFVQKSQAICDLNWPIVIRSTIESLTLNIPFTTRAIMLITAKNAALVQNLRSTLVSLN